jgi:DNA (cytosine-5)-methyltransferase 1
MEFFIERLLMRVIDLFSGPGGLGEGFAALDDGKAFEIGVSAEMEASAHSTLTLRAFFRLAKRLGDKKAIRAYYAYCNSSDASHPSMVVPLLWDVAKAEARQIQLGAAADDRLLDDILESENLGGDDTVLIGGPPCQAYSHMGRARNKGKKDYVPEEDKRNFLYREYLRVLAKTMPAIFVMENVKGILSSTPGGKRIFHEILNDLSDPLRATVGKSGKKYAIHSLTTDTFYATGMNPEDIDARDFIIKAENYGVPQARHRVILLGVREDIPSPSQRLKKVDEISVRKAIGKLPRLRSQISPIRDDSAENWLAAVSGSAKHLAKEASKAELEAISNQLTDVCSKLDSSLTFGGNRVPVNGSVIDPEAPKRYNKWIADANLSVCLNHEAKSHMPSDLGRYLFASVFCDISKAGIRGFKDFTLPGLAPDHANWETGDFLDRFKVQLFDNPSSTMTCHISKDGHSIIHPDPSQCRALTVREAARLQTFPDNYFFQGSKTQQYHQVGNAVPPLLANQIAGVVFSILNQSN